MKTPAFPPLAVVVVSVILVAEALLLTGLFGYLAYASATNQADSSASALGLVVMAALATIWVAITAISFIRGKAGSRGPAIVWQVLQGAVGIASNQGLFARPDIGSGLLIPAILVVALVLFSKPVSRNLGTSDD
jgi:mannose/fructose/N-acetylgalactosamine-specific phosphotransferase system component IID